MPTRFRAVLILGVAALSTVAITMQGCGEPEPPPVTVENFQAGKKDREQIIKKEYGEAAFDKGQAADKARAK
jgi:hypothetical protein